MADNDQTISPEPDAVAPAGAKEDATVQHLVDVVPAAADDKTSVQPPPPPTSEPGSTGRPSKPAQPAVRPDDPPTVPASAVVTRQYSGAEHAPAVPGYTPIRLLGEGTYGRVWLYQDDHTRRRVAIKFLTCRSNQQWQLLQAEVKQLALLDGDPGIIQLRDVEPDVQPPYYIMNYAEGGSLSMRMAQGALPVPEALRLFQQIVRALAYVHANGVRHCDLKPGNILLDKMNRPLLADFGQSHLETERSPGLGTFFYMAPEQADLANHTPDSRWDVYALGALLYAMVTGTPPRTTPEVRERLTKIPRLAQRLDTYRDHVLTVGRPDKHRQVKGVDATISELIDRCLSIDPKQRPRDALEVQEVLERWARRKRQRPVVLFALVTPVLLLLGMGGLASWATTAAVQDSETALVEQLQESDMTTAKLVANVMEEELVERKRFVENRSRMGAFQAAVKRGDKKAIHDLLTQFHEQRVRRRFDAWFVTDPEGNLLAYYPDGLDGMQEKRFAHRDWFHGQGDRVPDDPQPIRKTHISQPYVGQRRQGLALAISTPIYDSNDVNRRQLIGVLAARFPVDEMNGWVSDVQVRDGEILVINERCQCLVHKNIEPSEKPPLMREDCPLYHRVIHDRQPCKECYDDPADNQRYLVSGTPLEGRLDKEIRWGVVVQHRREPALKPIGELERRLWVIGTWSLVSAAIVTLAMWLLFIRTLRREGTETHG